MGTNPSTPPLLIPHIHLLCMHKPASDAFTQALSEYGVSSSSSPSSSPSSSKLHYTIHNTFLSDLPGSLHFDLVVSPANSYGILDGGFDDAISRAFSPRDAYGALTRAAQRELYRQGHMGYLPPGGCCLVPIPEASKGQLRYHDGQGWGCRYLALCPTMRVPAPCGWDRDVVYECVWSLLCAIDRHNNDGGSGGVAGEGRAAVAGEEDTPPSSKIESVLMTPLGTGAGGISDEKWAKQAVLAIKHWIDAKQNPEKWSAMNWEGARDIDKELRVTHKA